MLSKKFLEEEIKVCKTTIEKVENALGINQIVLKALEEALKK